jgi:hypothetical protein
LTRILGWLRKWLDDLSDEILTVQPVRDPRLGEMERQDLRRWLETILELQNVGSIRFAAPRRVPAGSALAQNQHGRAGPTEAGQDGSAGSE